jgi:hypothetical protein
MQSDDHLFQTCEYLYLVSATAEDGQLVISLQDATPSGPTLSLIDLVEGIENAVRDGRNFTASPADPQRTGSIFTVQWSTFVAYSVEDETGYRGHGDTAVPTGGRVSRVTNSAYLHYVSQVIGVPSESLADRVHWSIWTLDYVINVVSTAAPVVKLHASRSGRSEA